MERILLVGGGRTTCRLTRRAYTPPPLSRGSFFFCGAEPLAPAPLPPSFCQNRATRVSVNLTQSKQVKRQSSSMVATRQRVAAFLRCSGSEKTIRCWTLATLVLLASGCSSRAEWIHGEVHQAPPASDENHQKHCHCKICWHDKSNKRQHCCNSHLAPCTRDSRTTRSALPPCEAHGRLRYRRPLIISRPRLQNRCTTSS